MEIEIGKWGNSLAVRIPISMVRELSLTLGSKADLFVEKNMLVIKPKRSKYSLESLVNGITPENMHKSDDFIQAGAEEI